MNEDPNHDPAAMAASKSPDASPGRDVGVKNRKLIYLLIIILIFAIPLSGLIILEYTNNTSYIPYYPF